MIDTICDLEKCTGCSACASVCPRNCIVMKPDQEGFLYPHIDENLCVSCGMCRKICPIANKSKDTGQKPVAYAFQHTDEKIRYFSSSGGAFAAIAGSFILNGGAVFGAAFDGEFRVRHVCCQTVEELKQLQGSKYVQSDLGGCLNQLKSMLDAGREVMFSGTPCQIAAVKAVCAKEYANLTTVDIVCHGVPSPVVWDIYIKEREKLACGKTQEMSFRFKSSGWKRYSVRFLFDNGAEYCQIITEDPFMRAYIGHVALRKSCHSCLFKDTHRQSDLTLADFWGLDRVMPEINDDKGTTLVLVHTERGEKIVNNLAYYGRLQIVDFDEAIEENQSYFRSANQPPYRLDFQKEFNAHGMNHAVEKYLGTSIFAKLRRLKYKLIR